jgi:DNA-directed RNA polymerase subunit M/transcription elongation factor TFIIS
MDELRNKIRTEHGVELEEGIYDYAIDRLDRLGYEGQEDLPIDKLMILYNQIFVKVMLTMEGNEELMRKDPYNFCRITREQLNPEKWDLLYKNRTEDIVKKKGAHRCPKCKGWFTEYVEVQTRAADEAATVKVSCECGYRWKLN